MNGNRQSNGWTEWGRHVLSEMERLNGCIESVNSRLRAIDIDMTVLKVKAGLWGAIAGMIPVIATLIILYLGGQLQNIPDNGAFLHKLESEVQHLKEENHSLKQQINRMETRTVRPPGNE